MLSQYHIRMPRAVYGGENAIESLTAIIEACQAKQVVIFTDKGIRDHGLLPPGQDTTSWTTCPRNPPTWRCRSWWTSSRPPGRT